MDYGMIHFSLFPTIQFHIITRNIDQSNICITLFLYFNKQSQVKFFGNFIEKLFLHFVIAMGYQ